MDVFGQAVTIVETEEEEERLVESLQANTPTAPTPAAVTTMKSSTTWVKAELKNFPKLTGTPITEKFDDWS